ncbi:MAG: DNA repair protein RecN, partial [Muribaculaceae bacterium]|nr:DNA repair protein RecN [Muribaculaceae bacterium]
GEQDELEHERDVLTNMADIKSALNLVLGALSADDTNVDSLLKTAAGGAESLSELLDDADSLTERIEAMRVECRDIARTFESFDNGLCDSPGRLEDIESRLNLIYDLQRRFKVDTVDQLIALRDSLQDKIRSIELGDSDLADLQMAVRVAKKEALVQAKEISKVRHDEAARFADILRERAVPLGMKNLRVEISVTDGELTSTGTDNVEFLFAFNKNQPLLPVGNTASGGEISRLMLCIKSIVADKMELPSLIFDEVDTGVSGDVANRMGDLMHAISRNIQVIAITHLPQVAAKGVAHFKVYKEDTADNTVTRISQLTDAERVDELALMLSGDTANEAARQTALSLLKA